MSLGSHRAASAQTSPSEIAEIRAQIAALTQRLNALEIQSPAPSSQEGSLVGGDASTIATLQTISAPILAARNKIDPFYVAAAPVDRALSELGSRAELNAGTGGGRATISLSREIATTRYAAGPFPATSTRFKISASAPINKNGDRTDLTGLDSFANDFDLRVGWSKYQRYLQDPTLDAKAAAIEDAALAACKAKPGAKAEDCDKAPKGDQFVRDNLDDAQAQAYLAIAFPPLNAFAYGFETHVGYLKSEFIDLANFRKLDETHTPWGAKIFYSYLPPLRGVSWTGALEYQDAYEDQKSKVVCPPSTLVAATCLQGSVGAPDHLDKLLISLERRSLLYRNEDALISSVGIAAQATYDAIDGNYGFDLPIYFILNDKGALIGGIRVGWTSKDHDIVGGVFVSAPFGAK